ncbi:hypothetical protein P3L10_002858 [Capsicum annuum]
MNPLLKLQAKHRSQKIWNIEGQDMCLNRCRIIEVANIPYDVGLISALVERWRPETHTFHLRIGEATITLQDIEIMFGMVVDGSPILLEGSTDLGIVAKRQMRCDLTGWEPPLDFFSGIRRILVSKLAAYVKELDDITNDTSKIEVQQRVRLYLLWLCGGTLFSDKSNTKISLDYLIYLQDLNAMSAKAWGVAALSFLYYSLYRASMSSSSDVCGFLALVQMARVPLICGIIREWHMTDRAIRQSGPCTHFHEQHFKRDNRSRITQEVLNTYNKKKHTWDIRREHIFEPHHINNQLEYIHWYCNYAHILIGNPEHVVQKGYQHMTDRHKALVIGHETIYRMAQLVLRDSRSTSEIFAPNYAPPTQSAESPPVQVCCQGFQSASRDSTRQGRRGSRGEDSMADHSEEPHDNFGLSLATTTEVYYPTFEFGEPSTTVTDFSR